MLSHKALHSLEASFRLFEMMLSYLHPLSGGHIILADCRVVKEGSHVFSRIEVTGHRTPRALCFSHTQPRQHGLRTFGEAPNE